MKINQNVVRKARTDNTVISCSSPAQKLILGVALALAGEPVHTRSFNPKSLNFETFPNVIFNCGEWNGARIPATCTFEEAVEAALTPEPVVVTAQLTPDISVSYTEDSGVVVVNDELEISLDKLQAFRREVEALG